MTKMFLINVLIVLQALFIINTSSQSWNAPRDNACTTPDNAPGTCSNIRRCPALLDILRTQLNVPDAMKFLRQSHCGFEGNDPKVCCVRTSDNINGGFSGNPGDSPNNNGGINNGGNPGNNGPFPNDFRNVNNGGFPDNNFNRPNGNAGPVNGGLPVNNGGYPDNNFNRPGGTGSPNNGGFPVNNNGYPGNGGFNGGNPDNNFNRPGGNGYPNNGGFPVNNNGYPGNGGFNGVNPGNNFNRPGGTGGPNNGGFPVNNNGYPGNGGFNGGNPDNNFNRPGGNGYPNNGGFPVNNNGYPGNGGFNGVNPGNNFNRPGGTGGPNNGGFPVNNNGGINNGGFSGNNGGTNLGGIPGNNDDFPGNNGGLNNGGSSGNNGALPNNNKDQNNNLPNNNGVLPTSNLLPEDCGRDLSHRIIGGEATQLDEYPWMVLLEYQKPNGLITACGGALISRRYVLTAAHCLKGKDLPSNWVLSSVRLGEYNTNTDPDCIADGFDSQICAPPMISVKIEEKIVHENYVPSAKNQVNDIALLRLKHDVVFTDYIKPICLPKSINVPDNLWVAGWGKTENRSDSDIKLKISLPLVDRNFCVQKYGNVDVTLRQSQICAGSQLGRDSCRGDSGGPLMSIERTSDRFTRWSAVGIVSFGPSPCGMQGWPAIYTKVSDFNDWIVRNIKP